MAFPTKTKALGLTHNFLQDLSLKIQLKLPKIKKTCPKIYSAG